MHKFPVHGDVSFELAPPLLIINVEGPVNTECAYHYLENIGSVRATLASNPWASLVRATNLDLIASDVRSLLVASIKDAMSINLVATSVLFNSQEFSAAVKQFWGQIYDTAGLPYRFFNDEDEAESWLIAQVNNANHLHASLV